MHQAFVNVEERVKMFRDKESFEKEFYIENRRISADDPAFIIAEAGVNHNGDMELAKRLIDVAVEAGVDAVKFQSFKTADVILSNVTKAPYQKKTTDANESQYDMLKKLEVSYEQNRLLKEYCSANHIIFLSTPFEKKSLDELCSLDIAAIKIAATDITNIHFLRQIAQKGKPMILSAGMCYLEEVRMALQAIYPINRQVVLLQCTANYPIADGEANLNVIDTLKREFDILVGYSDHSEGIGASPYAVAKGAKVVEKHFTIDKTIAGPDQRASVTPQELKQLVGEIRKVEKYLGTGIKTPTCSEQFTRKSLQKCLVAATEIEKDTLFNENNVVAKRTNGEGISALYFDNVMGRRAKRHYFKDDIIVNE